MEALGRMVEATVGGVFFFGFLVDNAIYGSITLFLTFFLWIMLSFFAMQMREIFNL